MGAGPTSRTSRAGWLAYGAVVSKIFEVYIQDMNRRKNLQAGFYV